MNRENFDARIAEYRRLTNTSDGGMRWELVTDAGTFRTEPGAQCNNVVNPWHTDKAAHLTLNEDARVIGFEYLDD